MAGKPHNDETKKRISATMKARGIKPPNLKGLKKTTEAKKKISDGRKDRRKRLGYINSEETRKKLSIAFIGRKVSLETRKKMSDSHPKGEMVKSWKGGYLNTLHLQKLRRAYKANAEGTHTRQEWEELKKKYNYMCLCCKQQEPFIKLTEDHIVPLIAGGSNYIGNIQPLCGPCNSRKHTKNINYISSSFH